MRQFNYFLWVMIFIAVFSLGFTSQSLQAGVFNVVEQIVGGRDHACALTNGKVRCWGADHSDQTNVPDDLLNPTHITAGDDHTCAITEEGARCWGWNKFGQAEVPDNLQNPTHITAGDDHTCALTDDGVRCWGSNEYGQTNVPDDLVNPIQLAAKDDHTCALTDEGVKCWGGLSSEQADVPDDLVNPTQIAVGINHSCAVTDEGVRCWGSEKYGAKMPKDLVHPTQVSIGYYHTCALTGEGIRCWRWERVGDGRSNIPTNLPNPTQIAAGYYHTCAITDEGVKCWGEDNHDQMEAPHDLQGRPIFKGLETLKQHVYTEKRTFLDFFKILETIDANQETFLFFALQPFFAAIDSTWAKEQLHPDLPYVTKYYRKRFQTSSLKDFERSSIYLTHSLNILSHALTSTRAMLTLKAQREVSEVLLPALAEKLAKTELTPRDAEDIAALFTSHQLALTEMHNTPRLRPFANMITELTNWLGGQHD